MTKFLLLTFFGFFISFGYAQVLKGQLTDPTGESIPFAKIRVQNTGYGTVSNAIGNYQLELKAGVYIIEFSGSGFISKIDTITIAQDVTLHPVVLEVEAEMLEETHVTARSKKDLGKEIMKQVIDKRPFFLEQLSKYRCETYCFTSLEKEVPDSLKKDSIISKHKLNITEWNGTSYFRSSKRYKDVIYGFIDLTEKPSGPTGSVTVSFGGEEDLQPQNAVETNPYVFVNGYQDADINLFENLIEAPGLSHRPLISPLAYNAFLYYNFYVQGSFYEEDGSKVYEIRVDPRFSEEALFEGTLFIRDVSWELISYELGINKGALSYFKEMRLVCDYEKLGKRLVPTRREFIYLIKEGRTKINGNIRLMHSGYEFEFDDSKNKFWLESTVYEPEAFERDTAYWNAIRPFHLKQEEILFMHQQDSIAKYYASEEYLKKQDSIYNSIGILSILFEGVGFRNTFKKQEFYIGGLISQVVPFGVGGYRHRLNLGYEKEFKNGKKIELTPMVDYGFRNKDLKGQLGVGYTYNPRRFSRLYVESGDVYDFMTNYQSIQGTFAPANRVRNRKLEINHKMELVNGLYFKTGFLYSDRTSISNISYPAWADTIFGIFTQPAPFEGYRIFMTDFEFSYHFRQKYILKNNRKIIVGSQWPVLSLLYRKGWPNVFNAQANFDFLELRLTDEINLNSLGKAEFRLISGAFLRKKDLRIVEHKFFRTSDPGSFSNPMLSLQLLDTSLNTNNSYLQFNFIHHFNGFFLNKVWGINKLKLEEVVGGSFLGIPDAHFAQAEFYVGLERMFRIRKELFKLGFYAVTADSSFDKANIHLKFGVVFYNAFYKKWEYIF